MLIFRLKELFPVINGLTTSFFFFSFLKMPKIWVSRTMLNGEKKEDGLSMKPLQVMLLPPDEMLVHCRVTPQQYVADTHLYTCVKRGKVE